MCNEQSTYPYVSRLFTRDPTGFDGANFNCLRIYLVVTARDPSYEITHRIQCLVRVFLERFVTAIRDPEGLARHNPILNGFNLRFRSEFVIHSLYYQDRCNYRAKF